MAKKDSSKSKKSNQSAQQKQELDAQLIAVDAQSQADKVVLAKPVETASATPQAKPLNVKGKRQQDSEEKPAVTEEALAGDLAATEAEFDDELLAAAQTDKKDCDDEKKNKDEEDENCKALLLPKDDNSGMAILGIIGVGLALGGGGGDGGGGGLLGGGGGGGGAGGLGLITDDAIGGATINIYLNYELVATVLSSSNKTDGTFGSFEIPSSIIDAFDPDVDVLYVTGQGGLDINDNPVSGTVVYSVFIAQDLVAGSDEYQIILSPVTTLVAAKFQLLRESDPDATLGDAAEAVSTALGLNLDNPLSLLSQDPSYSEERQIIERQVNALLSTVQSLFNANDEVDDADASEAVAKAIALAMQNNAFTVTDGEITADAIAEVVNNVVSDPDIAEVFDMEASEDNDIAESSLLVQAIYALTSQLSDNDTNAQIAMSLVDDISEQLKAIGQRAIEENERDLSYFFSDDANADLLADLDSVSEDLADEIETVLLSEYTSVVVNADGAFIDRNGDGLLTELDDAVSDDIGVTFESADFGDGGNVDVSTQKVTIVYQGQPEGDDALLEAGTPLAGFTYNDAVSIRLQTVDSSEISGEFSTDAEVDYLLSTGFSANRPVDVLVRADHEESSAMLSVGAQASDVYAYLESPTESVTGRLSKLEVFATGQDSVAMATMTLDGRVNGITQAEASGESALAAFVLGSSGSVRLNDVVARETATESDALGVVVASEDITVNNLYVDAAGDGGVAAAVMVAGSDLNLNGVVQVTAEGQSVVLGEGYSVYEDGLPLIPAFQATDNELGLYLAMNVWEDGFGTESGDTFQAISIANLAGQTLTVGGDVTVEATNVAAVAGLLLTSMSGDIALSESLTLTAASEDSGVFAGIVSSENVTVTGGINLNAQDAGAQALAVVLADGDLTVAGGGIVIQAFSDDATASFNAILGGIYDGDFTVSADEGGFASALFRMDGTYEGEFDIHVGEDASVSVSLDSNEGELNLGQTDISFDASAVGSVIELTIGGSEGSNVTGTIGDIDVSASGSGARVSADISMQGDISTDAVLLSAGGDYSNATLQLETSGNIQLDQISIDVAGYSAYADADMTALSSDTADGDITIGDSLSVVVSGEDGGADLTLSADGTIVLNDTEITVAADGDSSSASVEFVATGSVSGITVRGAGEDSSASLDVTADSLSGDASVLASDGAAEAELYLTLSEDFTGNLSVSATGDAYGEDSAATATAGISVGGGFSGDIEVSADGDASDASLYLIVSEDVIGDLSVSAAGDGYGVSGGYYEGGHYEGGYWAGEDYVDQYWVSGDWVETSSMDSALAQASIDVGGSFSGDIDVSASGEDAEAYLYLTVSEDLVVNEQLSVVASGDNSEAGLALSADVITIDNASILLAADGDNSYAWMTPGDGDSTLVLSGTLAGLEVRATGDSSSADLYLEADALSGDLVVTAGGEDSGAFLSASLSGDINGNLTVTAAEYAGEDQYNAVTGALAEADVTADNLSGDVSLFASGEDSTADLSLNVSGDINGQINVEAEEGGETVFDGYVGNLSGDITATASGEDSYNDFDLSVSEDINSQINVDASYNGESELDVDFEGTFTSTGTLSVTADSDGSSNVDLDGGEDSHFSAAAVEAGDTIFVSASDDAEVDLTIEANTVEIGGVIRVEAFDDAESDLDIESDSEHTTEEHNYSVDVTDLWTSLAGIAGQYGLQDANPTNSEDATYDFTGSALFTAPANLPTLTVSLGGHQFTQTLTAQDITVLNSTIAVAGYDDESNVGENYLLDLFERFENQIEAAFTDIDDVSFYYDASIDTLHLAIEWNEGVELTKLPLTYSLDVPNGTSYDITPVTWSDDTDYEDTDGAYIRNVTLNNVELIVRGEDGGDAGLDIDDDGAAKGTITALTVSAIGDDSDADADLNFAGTFSGDLIVEASGFSARADVELYNDTVVNANEDTLVVSADTVRVSATGEDADANLYLSGAFDSRIGDLVVEGLEGGSASVDIQLQGTIENSIEVTATGNGGEDSSGYANLDIRGENMGNGEDGGVDTGTLKVDLDDVAITVSATGDGSDAYLDLADAIGSITTLSVSANGNSSNAEADIDFTGTLTAGASVSAVGSGMGEDATEASLSITAGSRATQALDPIDLYEFLVAPTELVNEYGVRVPGSGWIRSGQTMTLEVGDESFTITFAQDYKFGTDEWAFNANLAYGNESVPGDFAQNGVGYNTGYQQDVREWFREFVIPELMTQLAAVDSPAFSFEYNDYGYSDGEMVIVWNEAGNHSAGTVSHSHGSGVYNLGTYNEGNDGDRIVLAATGSQDFSVLSDGENAYADMNLDNLSGDMDSLTVHTTSDFGLAQADLRFVDGYVKAASLQADSQFSNVEVNIDQAEFGGSFDVSGNGYVDLQFRNQTAATLDLSALHDDDMTTADTNTTFNDEWGVLNLTLSMEDRDAAVSGDVYNTVKANVLAITEFDLERDSINLEYPRIDDAADLTNSWSGVLSRDNTYTVERGDYSVDVNNNQWGYVQDASGYAYSEDLNAVANLDAFLASADTAFEAAADDHAAYYYFGLVTEGDDQVGYLAYDFDGDGVTGLIRFTDLTDFDELAIADRVVDNNQWMYSSAGESRFNGNNAIANTGNVVVDVVAYSELNFANGSSGYESYSLHGYGYQSSYNGGRAENNHNLTHAYQHARIEDLNLRATNVLDFNGANSSDVQGTFQLTLTSTESGDLWLRQSNIEVVADGYACADLTLTEVEGDINSLLVKTESGYYDILKNATRTGQTTFTYNNGQYVSHAVDGGGYSHVLIQSSDVVLNDIAVLAQQYESLARVDLIGTDGDIRLDNSRILVGVGLDDEGQSVQTTSRDDDVSRAESADTVINVVDASGSVEALSVRTGLWTGANNTGASATATFTNFSGDIHDIEAYASEGTSVSIDIDLAVGGFTIGSIDVDAGDYWGWDNGGNASTSQVTINSLGDAFNLSGDISVVAGQEAFAILNLSSSDTTLTATVGHLQVGAWGDDDSANALAFINGSDDSLLTFVGEDSSTGAGLTVWARDSGSSTLNVNIDVSGDIELLSVDGYDSSSAELTFSRAVNVSIKDLTVEADETSTATLNFNGGFNARVGSLTLEAYDDSGAYLTFSSGDSITFDNTLGEDGNELVIDAEDNSEVSLDLTNVVVSGDIDYLKVEADGTGDSTDVTVAVLTANSFDVTLGDMDVMASDRDGSVSVDLRGNITLADDFDLETEALDMGSLNLNLDNLSGDIDTWTVKSEYSSTLLADLSWDGAGVIQNLEIEANTDDSNDAASVVIDLDLNDFGGTVTVEGRDYTENSTDYEPSVSLTYWGATAESIDLRNFDGMFSLLMRGQTGNSITASTDMDSVDILTLNGFANESHDFTFSINGDAYSADTYAQGSLSEGELSADLDTEFTTFLTDAVAAMTGSVKYYFSALDTNGDNTADTGFLAYDSDDNGANGMTTVLRFEGVTTFDTTWLQQVV